MDPLNLILGLTQIGFGLFLIAFSIILSKEKIPMNSYIGFRFRNSYVSDENWYRINSYGARITWPWGLISIIAGTFILFININEKAFYYWIILFLPVIIMIVPTIKSYRFANSIKLKRFKV